MAPAKTPNSMIGTVFEACTSATSWCDLVRSVISQAAPTVCIVVPMLEARLAVQMARKAGY